MSVGTKITSLSCYYTKWLSKTILINCKNYRPVSTCHEFKKKLSDNQPMTNDAYLSDNLILNHHSVIGDCITANNVLLTARNRHKTSNIMILFLHGQCYNGILFLNNNLAL